MFLAIHLIQIHLRVPQPGSSADPRIRTRNRPLQTVVVFSCTYRDEDCRGGSEVPCLTFWNGSDGSSDSLPRSRTRADAELRCASGCADIRIVRSRFSAKLVGPRLPGLGSVQRTRYHKECDPRKGRCVVQEVGDHERGKLRRPRRYLAATFYSRRAYEPINSPFVGYLEGTAQKSGREGQLLTQPRLRGSKALVRQRANRRLFFDPTTGRENGKMSRRLPPEI